MTATLEPEVIEPPPQRTHPMPRTAAFIAALRDAFGPGIDASIARGKQGEPGFYARENGHRVGCAPGPGESSWVVDQQILQRHYCAGCDGQCVGTQRPCLQRAPRRHG